MTDAIADGSKTDIEGDLTTATLMVALVLSVALAVTKSHNNG